MNLLLVILLSSSSQSQNPMGFDQDKTTHHFVLTSSGGHIEVTVRDASDHANLSAIREHLTHIAVQFEAGDFNIPVLVHGEKPPGSEVMKQRKDQIEYRFEVLKDGGRITMTAKDRHVLEAIHEFLRYQIQEHRTGDSAIPKP